MEFEFQLSISPSNEQPGLISFRMDWLDLPAVQGTLKILLQHHSSKASLLCSAFFVVQLSHPYMTTGKTIALTIRTFVDKVIPMLFNFLSRFVITFLPQSKRLLFIYLFTLEKALLFPFGPRLERGLQDVKKLPSGCREGLRAALNIRWVLQRPLVTKSS